jgi:hypothetical protein
MSASSTHDAGLRVSGLRLDSPSISTAGNFLVEPDPSKIPSDRAPYSTFGPIDWESTDDPANNFGMPLPG